MNVLQKIALVIVIIGAVNWLLIGIFDFNLVAFIFDDLSTVVSRIIYSLVGVAGLITISALFTYKDHRDYE
ncbi:MAG: DUF378 domain-containing protein [Coprobacillus sp.]|nr:DUF378 domain-containing protein [Coprobacillus sp.]MDY4145358.1 DUF378 domain-containing protein [Bacilli bacterium]CCY06955.1 putative uncharacterized protein [Coprobacillus sp. CAG:698]